VPLRSERHETAEREGLLFRRWRWGGTAPEQTVQYVVLSAGENKTAQFMPPKCNSPRDVPGTVSRTLRRQLEVQVRSLLFSTSLEGAQGAHEVVFDSVRFTFVVTTRHVFQTFTTGR
jgi:hypothetical protein